jgi:pimeloyl-ACP methyl ester carboxylesterase
MAKIQHYCFCLLISFCHLLLASETQCPPELEVTSVDLAATNKTPPKAVVIYAHGMNNNSLIFSELAHELQARNLPGVLLTWQGHEKNSARETLASDYSKAWMANLEAVVCRLRQRYPDTPLVYVGYSLGATIAMGYLQEKYAQHRSHLYSDELRQKIFDRMIFLAPALAFHHKASLLRVTSILPDSFPIPSLGETEYRAHSKLPAKMYEDFFSLIDEVTALAFPIASPLLLVLEPQDELIHPEKTKSLMANYFSKIQTLEIDNSKSQLDKRYHHLFVDSRSMGKLEWVRFREELLKFLSDHI